MTGNRGFSDQTKPYLVCINFVKFKLMKYLKQILFSKSMSIIFTVVMTINAKYMVREKGGLVIPVVASLKESVLSKW